MGARVRPHFLQEIPHQILSEHTPREARDSKRERFTGKNTSPASTLSVVAGDCLVSLTRLFSVFN